MRITLLRHCAVEHKYDGCYNGHIDISLSAEGLEHAQSLASEFREFHFNAIFCSDLKRAKETLEALKLLTEPDYTPLLREKSWGEHEGLSFEEINQTIPYENFTQWLEVLGGESVENFKERVKLFFFKELAQHKVDHVLVVTHAGVIKTLLSLINNITLEQSFSTPFGYGNYVTIEL